MSAGHVRQPGRPQVAGGTHFGHPRFKEFTLQVWMVGSDSDRKNVAASHITDLRMSEK
jgi:hypothetical protein